MNPIVKSLQQQLEAKGGIQSSEMLSSIFSENLFGQMDQEFGEDFDIKVFFEALWKKYIPSDELGRHRIEPMPNWNEEGTPAGFNIIPSGKNNSAVCSTFCLTIINEGFRRTPLVPIHSSRRLDFRKALLLLCDYWFSCLSVNQENLLLTPDWHPEVFNDYYKDLIESYTKHHGKKVFIVEISQSGPVLRYPV